MKSWIILIVVAVATTVTASAVVPLLGNGSTAGIPRPIAAPTADISASAPEVEVIEPLTYEFPTMAQETLGNHTWMFKNIGKSTLELRNLGTDCSCTVAQIGKADTESADNKKKMLPVQPGQQEPIEVTWNTRRVDGGYEKKARIGTNDPRKPEIVLAVRGKVYPAVVVIPADNVVSFQTQSNDEEVVRKAYLYSKDRPGMKITRLVSSNPSLLAVKSDALNSDEKEGLKVEEGMVVDITLKPTDKLGSFTEEVLIQTDHPEKPEVRLKVTGKVAGPITFSPERVAIRNATVSQGGVTNLVVWVRGRKGTQVQVEKVPPGFEVAFKELPQTGTATGTKLLMTVKVAPGTPAGQIDGEIVLKTDHPRATEIRVPVDVLVQSEN